MRAYERLMQYAVQNTASDETVDICPSTPNQRAFAEKLAEEMRSLGFVDVLLDENGYLYGKIPANAPNGGYTIGLIAHLDTSADVPSEGCSPSVVLYEGGDIVLQNRAVLSPSDTEELDRYIGKHLVLTDGNTLLGADDKAGIAEILTMAEKLALHPEIPHGTIAVAFTPDEEIGRGADRFDLDRFGADAAYTVDGAAFGEVDFETFNAATATVTVHGHNVHPGDAYGKMKNAARLAMLFDKDISPEERPELTRGYEGFFHLIELKGGVEEAVLRYLLRDHDEAKLQEKKDRLRLFTRKLNAMYGEGTFSVAITDSYRNMAGPVKEHAHLIEKAYAAVKAAGGTPKSSPIRGGTDGATLSFMGLPTPNLGTGSHNHHSRLEFACVEEMDAVVQMLVELVRSYVDFTE